MDRPVSPISTMTVHFRLDALNQSEGKFENDPLANRKTSLTILGPSPRYFWTNSDPTTRINDAVVWWATAFANIVWKMTSYRVTSSMMTSSLMSHGPLMTHGIWGTYLSATWWTIHEDTTWWVNTNLSHHNESVEVRRLLGLLVSECPNHQYRWN